jgi:hypothetical protein
MDSFVLPDGSVAESTKDVDKYLKRAKMAVASDYSKEYLNNVRYKREKSEKDERFLDFIREYKKRIWN